MKPLLSISFSNYWTNHWHYFDVNKYVANSGQMGLISTGQQKHPILEKRLRKGIRINQWIPCGSSDYPVLSVLSMATWVYYQMTKSTVAVAAAQSLGVAAADCSMANGSSDLGSFADLQVEAEGNVMTPEKGYICYTYWKLIKTVTYCSGCGNVKCLDIWAIWRSDLICIVDHWSSGWGKR